MEGKAKLVPTFVAEHNLTFLVEYLYCPEGKEKSVCVVGVYYGEPTVDKNMNYYGSTKITF